MESPPGDESSTVTRSRREGGPRAKYLVQSEVLMTGDVVTDARVRSAAASKVLTSQVTSTAAAPTVLAR